jgi:sulfate adenylyltransferase subunit 1
MVTAASSADAAVVLVDATKLPWADELPRLLPQTRRHSLLAQLLRVPSVVFAVNKLDAVEDAARAFANIRRALEAFCAGAGHQPRGIVPMSALEGINVVSARPGWAGYDGPSLLGLLETLPATSPDVDQPFGMAVQWVEKAADSATTTQGRRVFWGRVATGTLQPGRRVRVMPSGQAAAVSQVLDAVRRPGTALAGTSAGVILDREVDVSRGDWLLDEHAPEAVREVRATVAWLDDEPLAPGRVYWALHGHRWVKAKVARILHRLDIETLGRTDAAQLEANAIGEVVLALQEPLAVRPYALARAAGSLVLVDTATHRTSGAALVL